MGHYERGSHRIIPVEECPVHSARGNRIAFALRDRLARAGISAAGPSQSGLLRHLIIRTTEDDREAVAMLVVTRNDKSLRRPVRALLDSDERPDGFFINIHDTPGPFMIGPETIRIEGPSHVRETFGGLSYLISPAAFFQTNTRAAAVLQRCVIQGVRGTTRVLDLYCGSGLFSLPLAAAGVRVMGIEENRQAIRDAEMNVRLNRIPEGRVRFMSARVEEGLTRTAREIWDGVILDPPRQGCPKPILSSVFQGIAPQRAVYVSCNPDTLSAELPAILNAGYRIERLEAVDMFPHTDHIETVVSLIRNR
jgi:23S rRNA (uracil1939-C5)-methyltransferase